MVTYGAVVPPEIGVEPQDLTQQLAEAFDLEEGIGVLVAGVKKGSPAEASGAPASRYHRSDRPETDIQFRDILSNDSSLPRRSDNDLPSAPRWET